jgi:hypothetical protein
MTTEAFEVFIYCDDPSHAPKRVAVDVFVALPGGGWHERPPKKRVGRAGHVGSGMHLIGDRPAESGWALDPGVDNEQVRTKFELVCEQTPTCRRRSSPPRQETLFALLDEWRAARVSELPLAVLAASLTEQARRREPPEPPRGNG